MSEKVVYYYTGVFLNGKLLYITSVNYEKRICKMRKGEFALCLGFHKARELAFKLKLKGYDAVIVTSFVDKELINN